VRRPAPSRVGQHNAEVYGEIGIDAEELARLASEGTI
jgi:formyl-CoA transferase